jgi:hypothetical protein
MAYRCSSSLVSMSCLAVSIRSRWPSCIPLLSHFILGSVFLGICGAGCCWCCFVFLSSKWNCEMYNLTMITKLIMRPLCNQFSDCCQVTLIATYKLQAANQPSWWNTGE